MSTSPFDAYQAPELPGSRRRRGEERMVPRVEPEPPRSYYGQPVVKPMPWTWEIPAYLFVGGVAAGSGMLGAGAHATGRPVMRRNARLTSIVGVAVSGGLLVADLGRPERFVNMLRTVKLTSPMSVGTWIFSAFAAASGLAAAAEVDRMLGGRDASPAVLGGLGRLGRLGGPGRRRTGLPVLGRLVRPLEPVGSVGAALLGPPLAVYTSVLLSDSATPVWIESRRTLPFVFVSSAAMASGGLQLVMSPRAETGPAQRLAVLGAIGDYVAVEATERRLRELDIDDVLHEGAVGAKMAAAKALTVAGAVGAALGRRWRVAGVLGGLALATASALTRFAVVEAGIASAKDPRHTVAPQRARLEERQERGVVDDSITTAR